MGDCHRLHLFVGGDPRRSKPSRDRNQLFEMLHNISKLDEMDDGLAELRVKGMDWRLSLNNGNVVYTTTGVLTDDFVNGLVKDHPGLVVHVDKADDESFWQSFLISWLPTLLLLGFFLFFLRNLQAGGGKAMSFGKSKAKMLTEGRTTSLSPVSPVVMRRRVSWRRWFTSSGIPADLPASAASCRRAFF